MITCCINTASKEITPSEALGVLVDACEKLAVHSDMGVEHHPIRAINFTNAEDELCFTGIDSAEMSLLICAFYLCCYIRCMDEEGRFIDRHGSWRRLVARFALMVFHDLAFESASAIVDQLSDEDALVVLEGAIKERNYDS